LRLTRQIILLCLFVCALPGAAVVRADQMHLKDGRVIEVDDAWEMNGEVWFRQGKLITSVAKNNVVRVTRLAAPAQPDTAGKDGKAIVPRTVTRIVLKDGGKIDADTAWEEDGLVGYLMGNMQAFVERTAVERIMRGINPDEQLRVEVKPDLRFTTGNPGLDQLIISNAAKHEMDPLFIYLVMREESGFNYRAVSRAGARGLMQLMPATARRLGVRNIHDPAENVEAGTRYLKNLITLFSGDANLALAAYNAGEGAVMRYGRRVPPYRETQSYVRRINAAYRRASGSGGDGTVSRKPD
jgi:hypothetical protein